jgi:putative phosphoribosyl transferase
VGRRFHDRFDAGVALADALPADLRSGVVVVGLARGGVQTAAAVAERIGAPLDVVAVRKIGHPLQPEYALGAVAPGSDGVYLRAHDGLTDRELAEVVGNAKRAADELDRRLHALHAPVDVTGCTVLLVDDGLATGATMIAAVRWARGRGAGRVVAAVPVAAAASAAALRHEAEVVCPNEIDDLGAVGYWYERFDQVTDAEVTALLDGLV